MNMPIDITVSEEQLALLPAQRAMVAAKLVNVSSGPPRKMVQGDITASVAAKLLNVSLSNVHLARTVLRTGTPELIKAVETGRVGVRTAWKSLGRSDPSKMTAKNLTHFERVRQLNQVWKHLRDALVGLSSLPLPADVLAVAKQRDRNKVVMSKLPGALAWLQEFANVCNRQTAREERATAGGSDKAASPTGEV